MTAPASTFRIVGEIGRQAEETVRTRLADRYARGVIDRDEVARVAALQLHTFAGSDTASEIFRRCCVTWEADRETPITSHRKVVGPFLVAVKRLVRRLLRFQTEAQLSRQRDFNWNLLLVLRELLERERR
jgi:O-antigen chain-terminating methyltransferase